MDEVSDIYNIISFLETIGILITIYTSQDASLSELKISNGETLIVTEGLLPPKVFMQFELGLYSSLCLFFSP